MGIEVDFVVQMMSIRIRVFWVGGFVPSVQDLLLEW